MLTRFELPVMPGIRIETGYAAGCRVSSHYDPLVAKVIAHAPTRIDAIDLLERALAEFRIEGIKTNIPFVMHVLADADFRTGRVSTGMASRVLAATREPAQIS